MKQIDLREGARRQHRAVALLAVIQCWLRNVDGIVFSREHLERLIGLERFKGTRLEWLKEDFSEFFQYHLAVPTSRTPGSFASFYVSRRSFESKLPGGTMSDEQRVLKARDAGLRLALFEIWNVSEAQKALSIFQPASSVDVEFANYDERLLVSYLALLAHGQISPRSLSVLREESDDE